MSKQLYTYICPDCNRFFRTDNPKQKICSECLKYRQPHQSRKKNHKKILTLAEILHIANIYYKHHHKYISYGETVALIDSNPKKCICCGATTEKYKPLCEKCKG